MTLWVYESGEAWDGVLWPLTCTDTARRDVLLSGTPDWTPGWIPDEKTTGRWVRAVARRCARVYTCMSGDGRCPDSSGLTCADTTSAVITERATQ